jgi:glycosyltransferase involved in cell wall biosynthesis
MSQRLPVVVTPVGGARALVSDGQTGLMVPPRDPQALANALLRLLDDPGMRMRLAEAAFERVRGMTWAATAQQTVDAYTAALQRARAG